MKYNAGVTLQLLLTNDDGIASPGIAALRRALDGLGEVTTLAPAANCSAVARGITIDRALRLERTRSATASRAWPSTVRRPTACAWRCSGSSTPVPDLVVSGINLGANLGADVTYSGTVGAALEAALRGGAGIALSVESREPRWLDEAVPLVRAIVRRAIDVRCPGAQRPQREPARPAGGRDPRRAARAPRRRELSRPRHAGRRGRGRVLRARATAPPTVPGVDTDFEVVAAGCVALTPLHYDLLDAELLAGLAAWDLDLEAVRG